MGKVLDTNRNTFGHYDAIKAAGFTTVIRYVAAGLESHEKVIKPGEAHAIAAAGMRLGLVYEIGGRPSGPNVGARDGAYSKQYAPTVGAVSLRKPAIIWYAVDWDAGPADMPGIFAAFTAFKAAVAPYRVGGYASGYVLSQLWNAKLIEARWLTDSHGFRGTRDAIANGAFELNQALPAEVAGLDTDADAVHVAADGTPADIGDFVPFLADLPAGAGGPLS